MGIPLPVNGNKNGVGLCALRLFINLVRTSLGARILDPRC